MLSHAGTTLSFSPVKEMMTGPSSSRGASPSSTGTVSRTNSSVPSFGRIVPSQCPYTSFLDNRTLPSARTSRNARFRSFGLEENEPIIAGSGFHSSANEMSAEKRRTASAKRFMPLSLPKTDLKNNRRQFGGKEGRILVHERREGRKAAAEPRGEQAKGRISQSAALARVDPGRPPTCPCRGRGIRGRLRDMKRFAPRHAAAAARKPPQ